MLEQDSDFADRPAPRVVQVTANSLGGSVARHVHGEADADLDYSAVAARVGSAEDFLGTGRFLGGHAATGDQEENSDAQDNQDTASEPWS
jgi:hypothetical protein